MSSLPAGMPPRLRDLPICQDDKPCLVSPMTAAPADFSTEKLFEYWRKFESLFEQRYLPDLDEVVHWKVSTIRGGSWWSHESVVFEWVRAEKFTVWDLRLVGTDEHTQVSPGELHVSPRSW